ncbi:MAG TPA: TetR family transcriptional regulator [Caulobacteraceae bacterium]|nr:TetR family transcriptional regulator [Caulobacteraceae bacterium]
MSKDAPPRRRNAQATQAAIVEAARVRFMSSAYEQVSLRDVAAAAGIDPALVIRYFGSKEGLFERVLRTDLAAPGGSALVGDRKTFGQRMASDHFRRNADHTHYETINTAIWSAASPVAAKIVKQDVEERFVRPIASALEGPDAEIRAALIMAVLMGTSILRHMLAVPPLDGGDTDAMVRHMGAVLQHLADGD